MVARRLPSAGAGAPRPTELERILDTLIGRIPRTLVRAGVLVEEAEQPNLDLELGSPLERLCRYVSRSPIVLERMSIDGDGLMVYELEHPFSDGTTHLCRTWTYTGAGRSTKSRTSCHE